MGLLDGLFGDDVDRIEYSPDLDQQIEKATNGLQVLTAAHDELWQIGTADWSIDQDAGTVTFTSEKYVATAPIQFVGTYNADDQTWLWAWGNPSMNGPLVEHAKTLQVIGEQRKWEAVTTRKFKCPEDQCWELAALACLLLDQQGVYRGPAGSTYVFFTFGKITLTKP